MIGDTQLVSTALASTVELTFASCEGPNSCTHSMDAMAEDMPVMMIAIVVTHMLLMSPSSSIPAPWKPRHQTARRQPVNQRTKRQQESYLHNRVGDKPRYNPRQRPDFLLCQMCLMKKKPVVMKYDTSTAGSARSRLWLFHIECSRHFSALRFLKICSSFSALRGRRLTASATPTIRIAALISQDMRHPVRWLT